MSCHEHVITFGVLAFFLLGITGGLHCAGMCGPLSFLLSSSGRGASWAMTCAYHTTRIAVYATLGAIFHTVGQAAHSTSAPSFLTWIFVAPLLAYGLGLPVPQWPALGQLAQRALRVLQRLTPPQRAIFLGLMTPLLPCGLLYAALAASLAAPHTTTAFFWMIAFASGTIPWLIASHLGLQHAHHFATPRVRIVIQRGSALFTAGMMVWMRW